MTNEVLGATRSVDGRFRPESLSHFKEAAKNMAWLLERPHQKCQEDLARIWGYADLYELQQVLKVPAAAGPFEPRYGYLSTDREELVFRNERRIFAILFGQLEGFWRDGVGVEHRCFLVFELGLFQEAAEHRACFAKIQQALSKESDGLPLIHGFPLGLRSWVAARYTEPVELVSGWQKGLPQSHWVPMESADIRWQRRMVGMSRFDPMFRILRHRVSGLQQGSVITNPFEIGDDEGWLHTPDWETGNLEKWLTNKASKDLGEKQLSESQLECIRAFVQRPSRATAAACEYVKGMEDPVDFRDRYAFASFKAAAERVQPERKALFSSNQEDGAIQSLLLLCDNDSVAVGRHYGGQLWALSSTWSTVVGEGQAGHATTLQPKIHAQGSLIVPFNARLSPMSELDWACAHDVSDFANEAAAQTFAEQYLPGVGVGDGDLDFKGESYSVVEIDELLVAQDVTTEDLRAFFARFLETFEGRMSEGNIADGYGYWCKTLELTDTDTKMNSKRNQDAEYAEYVYGPLVMLINIEGCGATMMEATHRSGKLVSRSASRPSATTVASAEALAAKVLEATEGLEVDVVVYDGTAPNPFALGPTGKLRPSVAPA